MMLTKCKKYDIVYLQKERLIFTNAQFAVK